MPALQRAANTGLKLLYRYSHSRSNRHNERLWPHVAIGRDAAGRIESFAYRGHPIALMNTALAAGCASGPCHVIASGPSVNGIDYGQLALRRVMGVNGSIALQDRHTVGFDHYCFSDTGFVRGRPALVRRIVTKDLLLFTTPLCLWHVLQQVPADELRCRVFLIENPQYPALLPSRSVAALRAGGARGDLVLFDAQRALGFSHDIRSGVFDAGTVVYVALQIVAWLGHTEIVLHGVDFKWEGPAPRFYESAADRLPTTLDRYLPHHILPAFTQAARLLRGSGVRIVNLSPDSALAGAEFERRDWRTLVPNAAAS